MHKRILLFILVSFSVGPAMAQKKLSATAKTLTSANTSVGNFYYANANEPPRAIEFKERTVTTAYFLANINRYFTIPNEFTFVEVESNPDYLGMKHRLLQQYYKGIPLEGMVYRIHEKDGFMRSVNGKAVRSIDVDKHSPATLNEEQAFHLAKQYLNTKDTTVRPGKKLIVSEGFTFTPESFSVAFQFDIDVSLIERWRISIDASNGQPINKVSLVNNCFGEGEKDKVQPLPYDTGTGMTRYYGNQTIQVEKLGTGSRLVGQTEHGGHIGTYDFKNVSILAWIFGFYDVYDFYSPDNTFNYSDQKPAVSVQWATEQAYEYYFKTHSRNSFDNNGATITCYVHVHQNWDNAAWSYNTLLFGDGSNNNPLVELDVVSHELTHGVTQYEAGLQYSLESGALNESFSDIMGKAVEFSVFGDTATWQIAKHFQYGGLRDMSNPSLKNQPDTYKGNLWQTGSDDQGGVHTNSGVQNFWFYLLCKGGSGVNDNQLRYTVNAIGMDAASKITYRNLTEYLGYNSDYFDSRIGSLLATADLYGKNSSVYQEVANAWDAVGVLDEPVIISFDLYDITATTVKVKGTLEPRGDTVTYHFEFGTTPALGNSTFNYKYTDKVNSIVTGLQSQTKYYLRLVATNENGSTYSGLVEFTTLSLTPLTKIKQTVDVSETTATLYGQVNPNSLPTSFYFEYGTTPALGLVTPSHTLPDTTEFLDISAALINLQPRQNYYYRLIATNGFASSTTESVSFFTGEKPDIISYSPLSGPIDTEVTITGENFNPASEKNIVSFGATRAIVLSSTSTEIKVKVPSGASFGPISLIDTESGLSDESAQEFVPTFTEEYKRGDLQLHVGISDVYIYQALVNDMDGDNKPDIIALHYLGFSVYQNVNQGGDITDASFIRNTFPAEDTPGYLSLVDFDGNGLKDVVGRYQNGLRIYPNYSVPGYIFFGVPVDLPIANFGNLTFNDYDQDGRVDIAGISYLNGDSSVFSVLRNQNPKGSLSSSNFEQAYTKVLPYYVYFLTSGDLNNDSKADLMMGSFYGDFLSIQKNNSHKGVFDFEEIKVQDSIRGRFVLYTAHDFNQDGWRDIAQHSPYEIGNLAVRENMYTSPNITLGAPSVALNENVQSVIQSGDLNGDGKVDLLAGLNNRQFVFLENKTSPGEHLSNSSFEKFETYGMPIVNAGSGTVETHTTINDLNGDGRPEVINAYSYYYYPHDGYHMEIWQNSAVNCLDPSLITVNVSGYSATIVLPSNTTMDQYEIDYTIEGYNYWYPLSSTFMNLSLGYTYKLRARAKCYLGFTDYYYINFTTDCVNTSYFTISSIGIDNVIFNTTNYSYEVQYSPAGANQWLALPLYGNQITGLLPGTTYDLRKRGICNNPTQFNYSQFTTLCPKLSSLNITTLSYNRAGVSWASNYAGKVILEYSADNVNWTLINENLTLFPLIPGTTYHVRGSLSCTSINSDFVYNSFTTLCPIVSVLGADNVTPYSAKINWFDESNTGSYTLTYCLTAGGATTTVETSSTSYTLDGLSPGTQYVVSVAPYCLASKNFGTLVFSTVCYVPYDLSAHTITHTSAELSWSDHFVGLPYSVDFSIAGSGIWKTSETSSTTLSMTELRPGTRYEVRVHIECISETAPYASLFFETELYDETTFAPNPTYSVVTIYPSKDVIGNQYSIHDSSGKELASGELLDYSIDLSVFVTGIYILKIEGEKPMKIVKY